MPSKKHLIIGVGCLSALSQSELKVLLAQRLGHFSPLVSANHRFVYRTIEKLVLSTLHSAFTPSIDQDFSEKHFDFDFLSIYALSRLCS